MPWNKLIFVVLTLFLLTSFVSCNKNKDDTIEFDGTYPLALAPDVSWALVTDPYAAYKDSFGWNETGIGHCRRGEILQVLAKSVDKEGLEWYRFENGWLPSSCLAVYSNRLKAQTAADALKD